MKNPEILSQSRYQTRIIPISFEGTDAKVILAGSPISSKGVFANDGTAAGILLDDVSRDYPIGEIVIDGFVDFAVAQNHAGIEYTKECMTALKNIVFEGSEDKWVAGGGEGGAAGEVSWNDIKDKPFGEEVEGVLIDVTEYDALAEAEKNDRVANTVYVDSETTLEFLSQPFVVFKKSNIVSVGDTITYSINGTEYTNTVKSMEYTFRYEDDNGNLIVDDTGTIIGCGNACYADEGITTEYSTGDHLLRFVGDDHIILYVGEDDVEEMFNPLTFSLTGKHITTVPSIFLPDEVVTEEELANAINEVKEEMPEGGEVWWNDIKDKPFYTERHYGEWLYSSYEEEEEAYSIKSGDNLSLYKPIELGKSYYVSVRDRNGDYVKGIYKPYYAQYVNHIESGGSGDWEGTCRFHIHFADSGSTTVTIDITSGSSETLYAVEIAEITNDEEYAVVGIRYYRLDSNYLPKAKYISDVTEAPTAEQFNALLAALRAAGYMAE